MRTCRRALLWICLLAVAGNLPDIAAHAADHAKDTVEQVKQAIADKKAVLIDVREPAEWKAGHLEQATLAPLSKLKRAATEPAVAEELGKLLPKDKVIYCHCRSGSRVLPASEILQKLGYDVRPLKAGYADLLKAGFPAAKPAAAPTP